MTGTCDICGKAGKRGVNMMPNRVEGTVVILCRKCEDNLHEKGKPTKSLLNRLRNKED